MSVYLSSKRAHTISSSEVLYDRLQKASCEGEPLLAHETDMERHLAGWQRCWDAASSQPR